MNRIHQNVDHWAKVQPGALALEDFDGRKLSYQGLQSAISDAASVLKSYGVTGGDRVLIISENCAATVAFLFAASRLDALAVPINARMSAGEVERVIAHATPRAIVLTTAASQDATKHAALRDAQSETGGFGTVACLALTDGTPEPVVDGTGQVAVILYTTGTTGDPKGVMLTHANLLFAGHASANLRGIQPGDLVYGGLPITHVFGLASMVVASSHAGAAMRLQSRFTPAALYDALQNGVTVLPAVPQMHALLMQYAREQGHQHLTDSKLRYVSSGAAPLDPVWKREAEAFYGLPLQNGYGMTECTAGLCATQNEIGDPDTSVGTALPGTEVKLAMGDGKTGEVLARGPHVMAGYYRNAEATQATFDADGWLLTGDVGRFDDLGRLHIVGRSKEIIIRSGFNVFPQEVEAALNDHAAVVQSAVVGRAITGNEEVLAFVQVTDMASTDEASLKAHVAAQLSAYKRPSHIVLTLQLPAAATGKLLKHKMIDTFAEQLAQAESG
ncbi:long-chain fatty acid--CoA ligase [Parasedimentitalea marina]|uniref:Long-chain fatty acid--CoA ligase n=2 Tax=Parasedimentitalea marina TaxID=2483033 RepID=A0A3T0N956_9RHOB|nr:class I adenylate-forming enzyme family protein [Parasedimentitalea marina]AZV80557.1 long-chain fatty acid--CoA ligase [Parasedimentitalea marina]